MLAVVIFLSRFEELVLLRRLVNVKSVKPCSYHLRLPFKALTVSPKYLQWVSALGLTFRTALTDTSFRTQANVCRFLASTVDFVVQF